MAIVMLYLGPHVKRGCALKFLGAHMQKTKNAIATNRINATRTGELRRKRNFSFCNTFEHTLHFPPTAPSWLKVSQRQHILYI